MYLHINEELLEQGLECCLKQGALGILFRQRAQREALVVVVFCAARTSYVPPAIYLLFFIIEKGKYYINYVFYVEK